MNSLEVVPRLELNPRAGKSRGHLLAHILDAVGVSVKVQITDILLGYFPLAKIMCSWSSHRDGQPLRVSLPALGHILTQAGFAIANVSQIIVVLILVVRLNVARRSCWD